MGERNESVVVHLVNHLNKKPFRPLYIFKHVLKNNYRYKDISQVPKHYEIGPRKLNIALTQLRCFASFLNYDLFQV
jgi:hypothetical protein